MLGLSVGLFFVVRAFGDGLAAPPPDAALQVPAGDRGVLTAHTLRHLLLALAAVILLARVLGAVFRRFGQPAVIGEVVAGIALGPSLLGRAAPGLAAFLFPADVVPHLGMLAQVGIVLYMFLVGLELDFGALRQRTHSTVAISHASIVLPFSLGVLLALLLYPRVATSDVPFTTFALFVGVSMSVTAFPVLARILTDRGTQATPLGVLALTCAAVDDVSAWCLLALVVSVAEARPSGALVVFGLVLAYLAFMLLVVRRVMGRLVGRLGVDEPPTQGVFAAVCLGLLFSAIATESIGIHAIFGAFLFGAVIPAESALARNLRTRLEDLVVVLFLPAFFAFTGLRTQIGLLDGLESWLLCGAIVVVASFGKFGGTVAAARFSGMSWRDAGALGALMNTRGLMELIVLNVGLDLGVISPRLFAMLVIMALVTTFMTTPVLSLLGGGRPVDGGRASL
jgi:Kef-type K+ transport system membrane component KefB